MSLSLTPGDGPTKGVRRRKPETLPASPADPVAWSAWCARWKLDAQDPEVHAFAIWHLGKEVYWRDWGLAWLDWKKKAQRESPSGTRLRSVPMKQGQEAVPVLEHWQKKKAST